MSSLIRRKFHYLINSIKFHRKGISSKRMQQTHAALNSTTEIHQFSNDVVPVFKYAAQYNDRTAIRDMHGEYTYRGLYLSAKQFANELNELLGEGSQERIAFLLPNDGSYVITQWACWISGQIAVPLNDQHPAPVLDYYITDSDAKVFVTTQDYLPIIEPLMVKRNKHLIVFDNALRVLAMKADGKQANNKGVFEYEFGNFLDAGVPGDFYNKSNAMFVYTSGTTSKPKGVVLSHKNIQAQVNSLISAWKHTEKDIFLHTLPLHHVHGIINVLLCPLYVGGRCVMLPKFSASSVWAQITAVDLQNTERINVLAAVPTIYMKLIQEYDQLFAKNDKIKEYIYNVCVNKIRLMISGSSPLPKPIFDRWEEITGHRLLERYGMTETGMVLSNPLEGERIPGSVGTPLPGVEIRLIKSESEENVKPNVLVYGDSKTSQLTNGAKSPVNGELQVRGDNVFKQYWNRPEITKNSFTKDGWFKTGDTVQYDSGIYKMLGRSSVDIIKSGGYKVSAVEVETVILGHPDIIDCTVVGVDDITWGQKVAAVIVLTEGSEIILSQLRQFAKKSLPSYAVPTVLKVVNKIPKNSMGKVNKPDIIRILFPKEEEK
ncbi:malonate--CoA ligase ACSF3, mitochondrial [Phymastichus coffea]|uniref:malonate--CoA ligase ACSF3, mitochondrial n=1 Tax=Phymastichus coffea TaxID=108790 RepID=UPI00273C98D2|nr:malonate--CoA ligase ACSF3, mitochondrial [Phymastichus coffea]XP_058792673.1 malonate--CoA ligase ACSF3, mitochondrial [Phymastichus coffea]XP_058792674.1 malonate--CoA ligase ACSF3, mitochondrial [Phymastichus coffea]XP_058792675.1 malonate--CoA ligase ACSF3, mitochondrial [Phymastichus coffea]XP_058792676.1 malonate--CoA ligase ACSF3, mitochondrial [Phymastichus coffea]XP_058792677.1 malonate--CoA ligase ACSF3, mitochondrial [Phymastichus coffea]XP_058792678.1 malonate--CoA ligase ACSF3